ncbi:EAL domain-containing protein [Fredinandcohnia sp. QZ13]|uniref:sensor domain-containing protein n=1 Tax=Fredinandcohnia sp. QZ13 TaxID=3073144 RepID=UPI002853594D|nr:EAL domain-containing protein [Fredinandcohnia sp. QZ13]MDR4886679.1 EAL domain-containing protein [Fredinandcohnia sp. QZ13]
MNRMNNVILKDDQFSRFDDKIEAIIFEIILKHIKDLIYVMKVEDNGSFSYVFLNEEAKGHAKLTSDSLGKTLHEVLPFETADHLHEQYKSVMENKVPVSFQDVVVLADKRVVHGESILTPIFDENGDITFIVSVTRDISARVADKEMITYMAYHDPLTGLPNRSSLKKDLDDAVEEAEMKNQNLALMFIDLDRFKFFNDSMGHVAGDHLLKEVGKRLASISEKSYKVFRQGGDEFIVILPNTSRELSEQFAQNVNRAFEKPFRLEAKEFFISASIGISLYPTDGRDGDSLIKNADTALYRAKELGRSLYQFYSLDLQKQTTHLMQLETGLRKAIEKNELQIYYQPQLDLSTDKVTSFEALLRWKHPVLGFVSPAEFIPIAEDTGLILSIGEWVIQTVCRKLKQWKEIGYGSVSISINLSPKQFQQPELVTMIQQNIEENQIYPGCLEFELTEGAMQDPKRTLQTLAKLKQIGVRISVDDFGTGYSSLSYIKELPIDTLKIDQSFVRDVLRDEKDAAITTTIIHLAQSLGLSVIAEGVEVEQQVEFFKIMGCHKVQGYFFSKPIPEDDMVEHYLKNK